MSLNNRFALKKRWFQTSDLSKGREIMRVYVLSMKVLYFKLCNNMSNQVLKLKLLHVWYQFLIELETKGETSLIQVRVRSLEPKTLHNYETQFGPRCYFQFRENTHFPNLKNL